MLAYDPSDGKGSGVEGVDRGMETADLFQVKGDVFPDSKGTEERLIEKSFGANGPGSSDVSQVDHAAIVLLTLAVELNLARC